MTPKKVAEEIQIVLESYLEGTITGEMMVAYCNNIIARDDFPGESDGKIVAALNDFQLDISMYEKNPDWRKGYDCYYGEDELEAKVREFAVKLRELSAAA